MTYPFKYIKMADGYQALVWALEGPVKVAKSADLRIGDQGILAVAGEIALPIYEEMLPNLIDKPRILVTFLTNSVIDQGHVLLDLDLPKLYEMKGALGVLKQNFRQTELEAPAA